MAVDFSAFDAKMDPNLQEDVKNAKEYEDVPNGDYIVNVDKLGTDLVPEFVNYSDFAELVLDIFQEIQGKVELDVTYKASDFNPVSINEIYDI